MNIKEFAKSISGKNRTYPQFTKEEIATMKRNEFVVVYGYSDDTMIFDGEIRDEGSCFDGGDIYFNRKGVVYQGIGSLNNHPVIKAIWCDGEKDENGKEITWTYKTKIPHETFMIYDDGEPYCRGIVFDVKDVK